MASPGATQPSKNCSVGVGGELPSTTETFQALRAAKTLTNPAQARRRVPPAAGEGLPEGQEAQRRALPVSQPPPAACPNGASVAQALAAASVGGDPKLLLWAGQSQGH